MTDQQIRQFAIDYSAGKIIIWQREPILIWEYRIKPVFGLRNTMTVKDTKLALELLPRWKEVVRLWMDNVIPWDYSTEKIIKDHLTKIDYRFEVEGKDYRVECLREADQVHDIGYIINTYIRTPNKSEELIIESLMDKGYNCPSIPHEKTVLDHLFRVIEFHKNMNKEK